MGQKINPNGFRLGVNRAFEANCYAANKKSSTINQYLRGAYI